MRTLVIILVSLIGLGCGSGSSGDAGASETMGEAGESSMAQAGSAGMEQRIEDPRAAELWQGVMDSIAPNDGWQRTRYVQFDWIVSRGGGQELRRSHRWDRFTGDYRVEAPTDAGRMVALFNVNGPSEGERVWIDGERVPDGARSDSLAQRAHAMFINDSYWLLFPFKWADPGVRTTYVGRQEAWGETYEVVELTFEGVGLTPQNRYQGFVDPETGMFELWRHWTNVDDPEPRFTNRWTEWNRNGPILLSSRREGQDGSSRIYFENLDASTDVPEGAFAPPA